MKRKALLFLTAIYLLSLVGIGINRFYCCGKLTSVTLTYVTADHTDKDNCCKHESKSFKIKDSHFNVVSFALDHPAPAIIPLFTSVDHETIVSLLHAKIVYKGNAPPGFSPVPAYTLNCTYRI